MIRTFAAVVLATAFLEPQHADALGVCATKMLQNKRDEACFLAGVAAMKGYQDDDDNPENIRTHGRKNGDPFQCVDCLLDTKGIEKWGCTVVELRSWCEDAAKAIFNGAAKEGLKDKKAEQRDLEKEIETTEKGTVAQEKKAVQDFQKTHAAEVKDIENSFTDDALKKIFGKFDALFKGHPGLKKRAAKVMVNVLADEKKTGAFSRIDKLKDFAPITAKDRDEVGLVKADLEADLLAGGKELKGVDAKVDKHGSSKEIDDSEVAKIPQAKKPGLGIEGRADGKGNKNPPVPPTPVPGYKPKMEDDLETKANNDLSGPTVPTPAPKGKVLSKGAVPMEPVGKSAQAKYNMPDGLKRPPQETEKLEGAHGEGDEMEEPTGATKARLRTGHFHAVKRRKRGKHEPKRGNLGTAGLLPN